MTECNVQSATCNAQGAMCKVPRIMFISYELLVS
jgi:hypothetical protein